MRLQGSGWLKDPRYLYFVYTLTKASN